MVAAESQDPRQAEQRLHERFSFCLPVRIGRLTADGIGDTHETVSANISAGGAFIQSNRPFPLASRVAIDMLLSLDQVKKLRFILSIETLRRMAGKQAWVRATGIVIRQEHEGFAVIFDDSYQLTPLQNSG